MIPPPIIPPSLRYPLKLNIATTFATYVLSLVTGNVSQVDRVWTFLPTIYTAYWALLPLWPRADHTKAWVYFVPHVPDDADDFVNSYSPRALLMLGLVFTWMCRLSYNTYRRGLFSLQDEDYRWAVLRTKIPSWLFQLINLIFIAIIQNFLLMVLGLPTLRAAAHPTADRFTYPAEVRLLKVADASGHVGPALLKDQISREKITRFDHERIPERVVHARGIGAIGHFNHRAGLLWECRHDPRRAGLRYQVLNEEGNWDLVGNNIPIFFIQDAVKLPDIIRAVKPEPHNEVPQGQSAHNNFWDFVGLQPESAHMVMWVMYDRGIPCSYRMMQGFDVNTFTLYKPDPHGGRNLQNSGQDPGRPLSYYLSSLMFTWEADFHRRDLYEASEYCAFPKWKFCIQTISASKEHDFDFDILDATKVSPEELVPLEEIGEMVLDVAKENFPQVEQAAFCTNHVVPGIGVQRRSAA
ncbi:hypothetical protein EWM64_g9973 [Hericium alpestre]|uniref:catalase n=1 Tax=Hericium alpestre TaxID=135208 RepID=A0A4Y9ZKT3_9AGAM|nr:hypothetical protein EWM64_g9973 [Hericium alpestre]